MAVEMRLIINEGLRARKKMCEILNKNSDLNLSVRINPDLIISDASERDDTTNTTAAEKRAARRKRAEASV